MAAAAERMLTTAARANKRVKPLFGWLVYRRLSLPIAVLLSRTRVTPNQVTAAALGLGAGGAVALASGTYRWGLVGALLANLGMVADGIDGELARAKGVASKSGYVLDTFCDRVRDTLVIAGCGVGAARAGISGAYGWTIAALAVYLLFFYLSSISPAHWREAQAGDDLSVKHMLAWRTIRVGIGDSLAAIVAAAAIAARPVLVVQLIAVATPFAAAMKVRHLRRLRPWESHPPDRSDPS